MTDPRRGPSARSLVVTGVVALVVVAAALTIALAQKGPSRLGDNARVGQAVGGFLDPTHLRSCTVLQHAPEATRGLYLDSTAVGADGRPVSADRLTKSLTATLQQPGGERRRVPVSVDGAALRVPVSEGGARDGTRLCFRLARSATFALSIRGTGPEPLVRDAPMGVVFEGDVASWWSRAGDVASNIAPGRPAHQGGWTMWVGLLLIGLAAAGGIAVAVAAGTGRLGHGRRAVVAVALVGVASAGSWAFITPPLQTPDSEAHLSYVSYVAHHGRPSEGGDGRVSTALAAAQAITREAEVRFVTTARPAFSEETAGPRPAADLPDDDGDVVSNAKSNPILYYAVAAVPYKITGAGPFGGELWLRLMGAMFFGVTVGAVLLALREMLPGAPRLAAVGALLVALLPQAAFISGSVNPDALLFPLSALLLWRLARAFRRGLDVRDGVIIGLLLAAAAVSKLAGLMLIPGVVIAAIVLALRHRRGDEGVSLRAIGAIAVAFAAPFLLYQLVNTVIWSQTATGGGQAGSVGSGSIAKELSYIWQFFLPELPSMSPMFIGSPFRDLYVDQLVGRFGWADTTYNPWVYEVGRWVAGIGGVAGIAFLVSRRQATRGRLGELLSYLAILGAFLLLIAHLGYRYREDLNIQPGGGGFEQVRYLFPLLVFFAAMAVGAIRLLGRRLAPYAGVALVGLAALLSTGGVLTTLGRFYG